MVGMEKRNCRITKKASKFIKDLPEQKRKNVKKSIQMLMEDRTEHLDIKRLMPYPKDFRLRVEDIRILFRSTKEELFIFKAGYRRDVYR